MNTKQELSVTFLILIYSSVSNAISQSEIVSNSAIDINEIIFDSVDSKIFLSNSKKKNISLGTILNVINNYTQSNDFNLPKFSKNKPVTKIVNSRDIKILYTSKNKSTKTKNYLNPLVIVENIDNPNKNYLQIIVNKDIAVIISCLVIMITLATIIIFCFGRCVSTAKNDAHFFSNNNF